MNGKQARRERAVRRSQENTRLNRKLASVERSAEEQEFDRLMSELRDERAEAFTTANEVFGKALKAAETDRKKAVQKADASYIEKRDATIKRLASAAEIKAA